MVLNSHKFNATEAQLIRKKIIPILHMSSIHVRRPERLAAFGARIILAHQKLWLNALNTCKLNTRELKTT
jgi:hypothetical protein